MPVVLVTVSVVALLAMVIAFSVRHTRQARARWRGVAAEHGLTFDPGGVFKGMRMQGEIDGVPVRVHTISRNAGNHSQLYTVVEALPSAPLPAGLRLHQEGLGTKLLKALGGQDIPLADDLADAKLRVRGDDPAAIQAVLDHPAAAPALHAVMGGGAHTRLDEGRLLLEATGYALDEIDAMIRTAVRGARALDAAIQAPWRELAAAHGLRHEERPDGATLDGRMQRLPVRVRAQHTGGQARTRFSVGFEGGLPPGVRIRAGAGGPRLGDPILDGRIIVESTTRDQRPRDAGIAWLQARLQDPRHDLRGCLMDVLQGMPDATVGSGTVEARLPGRAGPELAQTLSRLVALGAALSGAGPGGDLEHQGQRRAAAHAASQRR